MARGGSHASRSFSWNARLTVTFPGGDARGTVRTVRTLV